MSHDQNLHQPVLLRESVGALDIQAGDTVVDATLGSGGHAHAILTRLKNGVFVGIDQDSAAVESFKATGGDTAVHLVNDNFRNLPAILERLDIVHANAILADLGWRIEQMGKTGKGFSFRHDEPLLMTLGDPETYAFTARDIVNDWKEEDIVNVLKGYGEEQYATRIARAIVSERTRTPIDTSVQLREVIYHAVPGWYRNGRIHPATKTFQALRIAVNDEFDALNSFIEGAVDVLAPGGRLAIITFHSLEDRIVKRLFRQYKNEEAGTLPNKKAIKPTREEILTNPRARSAQLRILEKL